jgi:hypothetical protein
MILNHVHLLSSEMVNVCNIGISMICYNKNFADSGFISMNTDILNLK